jgi:hypothetical protein
MPSALFVLAVALLAAGHSKLMDQLDWLARLRAQLRLSIRPPREDQRNDHCP